MPRRDPKKLARARQLRRDMSPPERAMWAIRFTNSDVMTNPDGVALAILDALGRKL